MAHALSKIKSDILSSLILEPVKTLLNGRSFGEIKMRAGSADFRTAPKDFFNRISCMLLESGKWHGGCAVNAKDHFIGQQICAAAATGVREKEMCKRGQKRYAGTHKKINALIRARLK